MRFLSADRENRIRNLVKANEGAADVLRRMEWVMTPEDRKRLDDAILVIEITTQGIRRALNE
jgi:hypothetical protein